jgi:hypothetical protein
MHPLSPTRKSQFRLGYLLLILGLGLQTANAATLIDDFDDFQAVYSTSQPTADPMSISSTNLSGVLRSLSITSSGDDDSAEMFSEQGSLSIGSDVGTSTNASIYYNFAGMNLASIADALVFDIASIDIGTQIRIIANGTSEFLFQNISLAGQYSASILGFSQPNVFGNLTNLEIKINSLTNTDLRLERISAFKTGSVPEPSSLALLVIGLLTLSRYRLVHVRASI